jgi:rod shape-determining protein MreB
MAAAIGQGISVFSPRGTLIVDIGGGTTEIAIISLGGIVLGKSLLLAGDEMDRAIMHYIRLRHGLLLGQNTSEELKIKIGSAYEQKLKVKSGLPVGKAEKLKVNDSDDKKENSVPLREKFAIIRGRDIETGFPKSLRISEVEVREALAPVLSQIIEGISDVLEEAPPELTSDILEHGILLTGGGSLLPGIEHLIVERTHIPVIKAEDPLTTVVRGTGKVLEDDELLSKVKVLGLR